MAYTTTDLANIRRLKASGAGTVSIAGKSVTYRSLEEINKIEQEIIDDLNSAAGKKKFRTAKIIMNKGL